MVFGITGNTGKDLIWEPIGRLISHLNQSGRAFCVDETICPSLVEQGLLQSDLASQVSTDSLGIDADVILSLGGDGTRLKTVLLTHSQANETPEHLVCGLLLEKKKK